MAGKSTGTYRGKKSPAPTSMRIPPEIMKAALKKADRLGLSRTQYVEQLLRRDLGMDAVNLVETPTDASVFA